MLEEKIMADYKEAMKARDQQRIQVLSFLRSQLKYQAIEKKQECCEDADCLAVIKKLVKQRQDSIEQFTNGGRQDLASKEEAELSILKSYLPPACSREEVEKIVAEAIVSVGAASMKDMGKVMQEAISQTKGRADGKMLSEIVRQALTKEG